MLAAGLAPVLVHMAKDSNGKFPFNPVAVNLLVELAKTLFALGTLIAYVRGWAGLGLGCAGSGGGRHAGAQSKRWRRQDWKQLGVEV